MLSSLEAIAYVLLSIFRDGGYPDSVWEFFYGLSDFTLVQNSQ